MSGLFRVILFVALGLVWLPSGQQSAQAGMITARIATSENSAFSLGETSSSAPKSQPSYVLLRDAQHWAGTPSGMGGAPSSITGGSATTFLAAVDTSNLSPTQQLEVWLTRQHESYHPKFLKTRLFRPPRS